MLGIVSVPSWAIAVAVIAFCLFVLPGLHLWIEQRQTARNPYRAAQAKLSVSALYVYPVKSLAGVAVSAHKVGARGFELAASHGELVQRLREVDFNDAERRVVLDFVVLVV